MCSSPGADKLQRGSGRLYGDTSTHICFWKAVGDTSTHICSWNAVGDTSTHICFWKVVWGHKHTHLFLEGCRGHKHTHLFLEGCRGHKHMHLFASCWGLLSCSRGRGGCLRQRQQCLQGHMVTPNCMDLGMRSTFGSMEKWFCSSANNF